MILLPWIKKVTVIAVASKYTDTSINVFLLLFPEWALALWRGSTVSLFWGYFVASISDTLPGLFLESSVGFSGPESYFRFAVFTFKMKVSIILTMIQRKLSVNEAKSTGLWARNYATIQQGLILKFAFGPKSFRAFGDVGPLVSFLPEERGPISRAEQRLVIAPSYLTVYELLQVPHILESFFFLISEHDVAFPRHHEFVQPVLHQIHFPPTGTTSWQSDHQSSVSCK